MMERIAVIGQSGLIPEHVRLLAEEIGSEIAKRGAVLLTGGGSGVMEAVSRGAKQANGLVVGILAGDDKLAANEFIDIPINTGLGFDYRSVLLVHSADAIIMIGGGNGTLGELSAAYMNKKRVIIVENSGGWSNTVKQIAFEGCYLDERRTVEIQFAKTAKSAVDLAFQSIYNPVDPDKNTGLIGD